MIFQDSHKRALRVIDAAVKAAALGVALYFGGRGLWLLQRALLSDQFITPTESMMPTLIPGDRIIVDKTVMGARIYTDFNFDKEGVELKSWRTRGRREVRVNDICVFNFPLHGNKINFVINHVYAKRCVGVPGDTVWIADGHYRNSNFRGQIGVKSMQDSLASLPDSLLPAEILPAMPYDEHLPWTIKDFGPLYLPRKGDRIRLGAKEGCLYRILLEWETGKTITYDWERDVALADGEPLEAHTFSHGYYFMCGDNVGNSSDSRYWGPVPEEYIVGVVTMISYSVDKRMGERRKDRTLKKVISDSE